MPLTDARGFHDAAFERSWYPKARKQRGTGTQPEELRSIITPRTRIFSGSMQNGAGAVTWYVFPRCIGPGLIKDIAIMNHQGQAPVQTTLEIGVAYFPLPTGFQAQALPRPFEVLTEFHPSSNYILGNIGDGLPISTLPTPGQARPIQPLDLIITQPEFYPVLGFVNDSGLVLQWHFTLRVIENVDPEALRFFL